MISEAMMPHGTIVVHGAISPEPTPYPLKIALQKSLSLRGYVYTEVTGNPVMMTRAVEFARMGINRKMLLPRIDSAFSLDEIVDAHRYLETGKAFGKIVVRP